MKTFSKIATSLAVISLVLTPAVVHAQVEEVNPDPNLNSTTTLPETGGVQAPDTGIAPSNRAAQNVAVFAVGSLLGAGLGLGIVAIRKKKLE